MLTRDDRNTVEQKAKELADADFKVNGGYINQPYDILHNDMRFKARVNVKLIRGEDNVPDRKEANLIIVLPEQFISSRTL
jgi:hypothetical protein